MFFNIPFMELNCYPFSSLQIQFFRQFSAGKYLQGVLPEEGRDDYSPSLQKKGFYYFDTISAKSNGGGAVAFGRQRAAYIGLQVERDSSGVMV